jgi:hypothetical protein
VDEGEKSETCMTIRSGWEVERQSCQGACEAFWVDNVGVRGQGHVENGESQHEGSVEDNGQ